ncbi:hypothetical protein JXB31_03335 [Candidatus Woesearchaeota archaeon]|nr:hypothetical protein [Candidatus Woesearchaeota archaeon]
MPYADIVFPNNNEDELIAMAEKLGYRELCLTYSLEGYKNAGRYNPSARIRIHHGIIASPKDVQKARNKADLVIVKTSEDTRETVEKYMPDIVIGMEDHKKRDSMHQRNSGLNEVICKIAKGKHVAYGISFAGINSLNHYQPILGRIMQNLKLCKKYNCMVIVGSFAETALDMRSPADIASFLELLGMDARSAKNALMNLPLIIERNRKIRQKKLIADGVEITGDA